MGMYWLRGEGLGPGFGCGFGACPLVPDVHGGWLQGPTLATLSFRKQALVPPSQVKDAHRCRTRKRETDRWERLPNGAVHTGLWSA